jgi:methylglutaconyl-CoA hydratase
MFNMNRPSKRNALSRRLIDEFQAAMEEHRDTARCVILKSSVEKMFCAGADLSERKTMSEEEAKAFVRKLRATFTMFEQLPCPTIAVVDGPALGGGCELALCGDLRVATKQAIFGLPETGLAIIPGAGGTQRLSRLIGVSMAKELIFTGDRISADHAHRIGLTNHVSEDFEAATAKAVEIAEKIGTKGPIAIWAAKRAVHYGIELPLQEGLALEDECYQTILKTEDRLEGLRAFSEKRQPQYKGK